MSHPTVSVVCPECGNGSVIEYVRLGARALCAGCRRQAIAKVPQGGHYPLTGWALSFADFERLAAEPAFRDTLDGFLLEWFGASEREPAWELMDLHLRIQADGSRQYALYQAAMSLWR